VEHIKGIALFLGLCAVLFAALTTFISTITSIG